MDKTESLLRELKDIISQQKAISLERQRHGENFNIFKIMQLARNETRLHSAFLAELLSPEGSHGLGNRFLASFLQRVADDLNLNTDHVKVSVEKFIGNINADVTQGGRIDLLIEDNKGKAVIIENKIDASDQENQLLRYYNYGSKTYNEDFRLLYLTKDGTQPSEFSTNKQNINYSCISYRTDIMDWLNNCVEIAARQPLVRETIQQYILNIQDILGLMDENLTARMVDIATSKEYAATTLSLIENGYEIQKRIRINFIESLKNLGRELGYSVNLTDNEESLVNFGKNQWMFFTKPDISNEWGFRMGWLSPYNDDGARYGISRLKNEKGTCLTEAQLKELPHIYNEGAQDAEWPLGWKYFWGEDGKNGAWWRWDNPQTLRDMVNGRFLNFIEDQLKKVINEGLIDLIIQKTNQLCSNPTVL